MIQSLAMGRPRKVKQNTFALGEGDVKRVDTLKGFRRICTALCVHLPFIKDGDIIMMREPHEHMIGEANVLDVKHVRLGDGSSRTALALQLMDSSKEEVELLKEDY